jgi:hypothetical protein
MNLDEFVAKYNGQRVDFDGVFGYQCVDLFRQYCKDVWTLPHLGAVEGAKDLFLLYDKLPLEERHLDRIQKGPFRRGDVLIWGASLNNQYGHVAILLREKNELFEVLEQDGFKQDGTRMMARTSMNLLGALRKKV